MKGIKLLQLTTVLTFTVFCMVGLSIVIFIPEKMPAFVQFLGAMWPIFIAEIIPAFLGTPLKEYVKTKKAAQCVE